eukprot:jgi/Psemu1/15010/gm1.15010_g
MNRILQSARIIFLLFLSVHRGRYENLASAFSLSIATGLQPKGPNNHNDIHIHRYKPVVVVGKIIIDEYGDPHSSCHQNGSNNDEAEPEKHESLPLSISIGGGGPQAAFGAAAALSVWDSFYNNGREDKEMNGTVTSLPSRSPPPVIFVAPVGKDWTMSETSALLSTLNVTNTSSASSPTSADDCINVAVHLIQSDHNEGSVTPRIRLWHDRDQVVHWYAIDDSFGQKGADGLWRNRPSPSELTSILHANIGNRKMLDNNDADNNDGKDDVVLHVIAEAGKDAAGGKLDCLPLVTNPTLLEEHLSFVGIEPVASGECIGEEDALSAASILQGCWEVRNSLDSIFWCPDQQLDKAMRKHNLYDPYDYGRYNEEGGLTIATRDGPRGSQIWRLERGSSRKMTLPSASLATKDGEPVDPTGAGNAFSAAMTALLGNGVPFEKAACIATGVGAVVCEHEGLPTAIENMTWLRILDRIHEAAMEVSAKL